jgi:hypothetical protein
MGACFYTFVRPRLKYCWKNSLIVVQYAVLQYTNRKQHIKQAKTMVMVLLKLLHFFNDSRRSEVG